MKWNKYDTIAMIGGFLLGSSAGTIPKAILITTGICLINFGFIKNYSNKGFIISEEKRYLIKK